MKTYPTRIDMVKEMIARDTWVDGVEVGVQRGEFAQQLIDAGVIALSLVDPWRHIGGDYSKDPADLDDGGHEANYQFVRERFRSDVENGDVWIHRMESVVAAAHFGRMSMSFVNIDANHTVKAVLADLQAWAPVVGQKGMLMVHDYVDNEASRRMGFGVIAGVNMFLEENPGWRLSGITEEEWPTVQLTRK